MGHCQQSIVISAPAERVWAAVRNFHDGSFAPGVIESVEVVGDVAGDQVGAGRVLNGVFHETLMAHSDHDRMLQYSIDDGPGAVAKAAVENYVGTLRVLPVTADDTAFVQWGSSYETANDPAVAELCNPIYHALLQALKSHCEAP